jgi:prepilin-type N-terminal cleavage/methylation domain-containing protein
MYKKNKNAFTLAEVLITLGIIGVIAALTIPMLVASYQKRVLVTQYKTNYSILSQGFQKMISSEGVSDFGDYRYFLGIGCYYWLFFCCYNYYFEFFVITYFM